MHAIAVLGLAAALAGVLPAAAAPAAQEENFDTGTLALGRVTLRQVGGAPVRYYLSRAGHKAPLVLYVQGSGCIPPFGLVPPGGNWDDMQKEYDAIFAWFDRR